jgi:hypothetical protein
MFERVHAMELIWHLNFPRPCGSSAEKKAQAILARELEILGLQPQWNEFEDWWIEPEGAVLECGKEVIGLEPAVPLTFLAAFPWMKGLGLQVEVTGTLTKLNGPVHPRGPLVLREDFDPTTPVVSGSAAQLLLFPYTPEFTPYALVAETFVPSAYVDAKDRSRLHALLGRRATLRWTPKLSQRPFTNLFVEIPGKTIPDEAIVVGAHLDSFPGVVGSSDNAAGCAIVLQAARLFRDRLPDRTVYLVWFTGEELDRRGSRNFIEFLQEKRRNVRLFINVDGGFERDTGAPWIRVSEDRLAKWAKIWTGKYKLEIQVAKSKGNDEEPFQASGIPTFRVCGRSRFSAHLPQDRPEEIDQEKLELMGRITLEAGCRAASLTSTV